MDRLEQYLSKQPLKQFQNERGSLLLRDVAYKRLKDAIRHADLQPGQPLSESRLSKLLGISRTPIREALHMLAQDGLINMSPGQTVTVASHSVRDVLDVVHIRALLEPELVRLIARTMPQRGIEELFAVMEEMETAAAENDKATWSKADTRFHEILSEHSPNGLLGETILHLRNRVHHLANIDSETNPDRLTACTQEHRVIVEAIAARDGQAAEQAMHAHIRALRESLFARLSYGL